MNWPEAMFGMTVVLTIGALVWRALGGEPISLADRMGWDDQPTWLIGSPGKAEPPERGDRE